ncbi:formylglycine-generating enzyme family protein [bacterium]|nr:formylglycine-generating enzyme family protein [bacterium]
MHFALLPVTARRLVLATLFVALMTSSVHSQTKTPAQPALKPIPRSPALPLPAAEANVEKEMKAYAEVLEHTSYKIELLPIPAGEFVMGSPNTEPGRNPDEGPQRKTKVDAFWMSKCEITWNAYETWGEHTDKIRRELLAETETDRDPIADAVTRPTPPYTDMSFGMGKGKYPAISMTQHAARGFCKWLTAKTGRYYRLPTEAEWEYACRAGTTTAYSFGDDPSQLDDYAWHEANSEEAYHKVGKKKPNPWGLHDMHGNVAEWVLDQYSTDAYARLSGDKAVNPLQIPSKLYPRVVRGGGWDHSPGQLRSAARMRSDEEWKQQDPQLPVSIWYHTDALSVGFRVVRPLIEPADKQKADKWDKTEPLQIDPPEGADAEDCD